MENSLDSINMLYVEIGSLGRGLKDNNLVFYNYLKLNFSILN